MDFREEYKKAAEIIAPDQAAAERIKSGARAGVSPLGKRVSALRTFAVTGGAVAACAVITISAVMLMPRSGGSMVDSAANEAAPANGIQSPSTYAVTEGYSGAAAEDDADVFYQDYQDYDSDPAYDAVAESSVMDDAAEPALPADGDKDALALPDKGNADSGAGLYDGGSDSVPAAAPAEDNEKAVEYDNAEEEEVFDEAPESYPSADSSNAEMFLGFELSEDLQICRWNGIIYTLDPEAEYDGSSMLPGETVELAGTVYDIEYSDTLLYLFSGGEFLGAYFAE